MKIEDLYKKFINECKGKISTDTREIIPQSLFFAWKGEHDDAHHYLDEAFEKGACYAIVDNPDFKDKEKCIYVENSIATLQELAHYHRKQFHIPLIGVTGSNGKTTTKELIRSVLETEKNVLSTKGNLNNHIGVPKTLLEITKDTDIAIIEMGANHVGEIAELCRIAEPSHGLITNIGRAHLGLFGGFDGVVRAKTELYRFLEKNNEISFVNGYDKLLLQESNSLEKITYLSSDSDYPVESLNTLPFVSVRWKGHRIQSQLTGEYNLMNIAGAIAVGDYFGIDEEHIVLGIEKYFPQNSRSEIVETEKGNSIIKDFYNANTSSMKEALENLARIPTEKEKIVILGDMFELGDFEYDEHLFVADLALSKEFQKIILVGEAFSRLNLDDPRVSFYKTSDEAIFALQKSPPQNSFILLKASNGMNFKKLFHEVDW